MGLGQWSTQMVVKIIPHGVLLGTEEHTTLLPRNESEGLNVGDEIDVFLYLDSEDRPIYTRREPKAIRGEAGWMTITGALNI